MITTQTPKQKTIEMVKNAFPESTLVEEENAFFELTFNIGSFAHSKNINKLKGKYYFSWVQGKTLYDNSVRLVIEY